jgi:hypothetical protein
MTIDELLNEYNRVPAFSHSYKEHRENRARARAIQERLELLGYSFYGGK